MLQEIPAEIILQIVESLPSAKSVSSLARVSHHFHAIVQQRGWQVFVRSRFPSRCPAASPSWAETARSLTSTSRCWDRQTFLARVTKPGRSCKQFPIRKGRLDVATRQRGTQTMGYQPIIDSHHDSNLGYAAAAQEVVAWGAGRALVVRAGNSHPLDEGNRKTWLRYAEDHHVEGRDDITSVNLLRPNQRHDTFNASVIEVVVGRRNGELSLLRLTPDDNQPPGVTVHRSFDTGNERVGHASVSPSPRPLLAACLSDKNLAVYPVYSSSPSVRPLIHTSQTAFETDGQTWATEFLSSERLAIAAGPSTLPLQVFHVDPAGSNLRPIRSYPSNSFLPFSLHKATAKSIAPIRSEFQDSEDPGDIFLSGWSDGICR